MKAVVDPNKDFENEVFGADAFLQNFPDIRPGGTGVDISLVVDGFYYILDSTGKVVHDTVFFSKEELYHLIVTDEVGSLVVFPEPPNSEIVDIPGVIRRGSLVRDTDNRVGVVVSMNSWGCELHDLDDENHGMIEVWLRDECNYGGNNCEHYTLHNFKDFLEVLEY